MLPKVEWMVAADTVILWFLSSAGRWRIAATPSVVALNVGLSQSHSGRRMKLLEDGGLVELVDDRGYYRITDKGEQFVLGQLDGSELNKLEPEE